MRSIIARVRPSIVLAGLVALAACADHNPAGAPDGPSPLPPSALAAVTCTATVADGTVVCGGESGVNVPGVRAAVIGGQGVYVRLASSGASYDGADTFRVSVTVENLTPQALGTADGMTPSSSGVRIFFASGPTATGGTGAVTVANADGEAFFSAAGQPYFQYDGILAPGDTSAAKEWRFALPKTVTRFGFVVYVAAPVRQEGGWMGVTPLAPSLAAGDTLRLTATARNVAGGVVAGAPVAWTSSDTSIARVDARGVVTGVRAGTARVTAAGVGRSARVTVRVYAQGAQPVHTIHRLEVTRGRTVANGRDSLVFRVSSSGPLRGETDVVIILTHPRGGAQFCVASSLVLTEARSEWECAVVMGAGDRGGAWELYELRAGTRAMSRAELVAAGAPMHVYVDSPGEDNEPPTLDSLVIRTDTVVLGRTPFRMTVTARDGGVGVWMAEAWISGAGNPRAWMFAYVEAVRPDGALVLEFQEALPGSWRGGTMRVDSLFLRDNNHNERTVHRAELEAAGFSTTFTVVSPDTTGTAP